MNIFANLEWTDFNYKVCRCNKFSQVLVPPTNFWLAEDIWKVIIEQTNPLLKLKISDRNFFWPWLCRSVKVIERDQGCVLSFILYQEGGFPIRMSFVLGRYKGICPCALSHSFRAIVAVHKKVQNKNRHLQPFRRMFGEVGLIWFPMAFLEREAATISSLNWIFQNRFIHTKEYSTTFFIQLKEYFAIWIKLTIFWLSKDTQETSVNSWLQPFIALKIEQCSRGFYDDQVQRASYYLVRCTGSSQNWRCYCNIISVLFIISKIFLRICWKILNNPTFTSLSICFMGQKQS